MTAVDLLAGLVLEDGRRWGQAAEQWQWDDARAVLDTTGPRRHFLTRPRGASKTGDLGGAVIAALIDQAPPQSRSYGFAVDRDQAGLIVDAVSGFLERTEEVRGALKLEAWKMTNPRNGATFEIWASDDASAFGLKPWLVVCDEFAQWKTTLGPRRLWRAVFSALPKVPDSRLAILTSAGDPAHWSHKILETAYRSDRWRVNEVRGPTPWISEDDLEEQRSLLPEFAYRRLHLNEWTAADDRISSLDDIRECVTLDEPQDPKKDRRYVVSVDLGLVKDKTVVSVMHREDRTVVLDRQASWQGSKQNPVRLETVAAFIREACRQFNGASVIADPWQAVQLLQQLREEHITVVEYTFSQSSVGRLAVTLHRLLRDHQLAIYPDEELIDELANVRLVETSPGVYRIDHDPDKHDDRAISLALGAHWLVSRPAKKRIESKALAEALAIANLELAKSPTRL